MLITSDGCKPIFSVSAKTNKRTIPLKRVFLVSVRDQNKREPTTIFISLNFFHNSYFVCHFRVSELDYYLLLSGRGNLYGNINNINTNFL